MTAINWDWAVSNPGPQKLLVWLEPWAEEFEVPVRSTIALNFSSENKYFELSGTEMAADHFVVWASAGQTVRVFIDNTVQESASASFPVPGGFNGSSRQFLNIVFAAQPSARLGGRSPEARRSLSFWQKARRLLHL